MKYEPSSWPKPDHQNPPKPQNKTTNKTQPHQAAGKVRTSGWLSQPKEAVKQCETRGNEFIPCAQYVIIRFMAASLPSKYNHCPAADKISCIFHTVSYGTDPPCFKWGALLHSQRDCKIEVADWHGRQSKAARIPQSCLRKWCGPCETFRLRENS